MNYFDHNASREGYKRVRALPLSPDNGFPALYMSAREVWRARMRAAVLAWKPCAMLPPKVRP